MSYGVLGLRGNAETKESDLRGEEMTEERIVEPLMKMPVTLDNQFRFVIPSPVRKFYGIKDKDIVEFIIRKLQRDEEKVVIVSRGYLITQVSVRGLVKIPLKLRKEMGISKDDFIEVILVDYHSFEKLLSEKGKSLLVKIKTGPYVEVIDRQFEQMLLEKATKYFLHAKNNAQF